MKIILIYVGNVRDSSLKNLTDRFCERIPHYIPFETSIVPDISSKGITIQNRKEKEGKAILGKISQSDFVVLLDEKGKQISSRDLAEMIDRKSLESLKNLIFVIGGPFGFSDEVYSRANHIISLSKMTFTHEMAIFITTEQIYRAMTILRGEPYHHD